MRKWEFLVQWDPLMSFMSNGRIAPLEISIVQRANNPILPLPSNVFLISIVEFVTCTVLNSEQGMTSTFSANIESVRKDVECCFGILKGRWKSLDFGFKHRRIQICQHIFVACCVLHNMMLDEMVREEPQPRVGRGCQMPNDGIWLEGPTELSSNENTSRKFTMLKLQFHRRRNLLAHHLWVWKSKCKNMEIVPNLNP